MMTMTTTTSLLLYDNVRVTQHCWMRVGEGWWESDSDFPYVQGVGFRVSCENNPRTGQGGAKDPGWTRAFRVFVCTYKAL